MDVEGVCLEEGEEEGEERDKVGEVTIIRGEDSELNLSFQGYATELRQCQSRMKTSQVPLNARDQSEGIQDSNTDMYKATIVWVLRLSNLHQHFPSLSHCLFKLELTWQMRDFNRKKLLIFTPELIECIIIVLVKYIVLFNITLVCV